MRLMRGFHLRNDDRLFKQVGPLLVDPGSPWQNGHNESFNGVFRDGCLDRWLFYSVQESRRVINAWLDEYNTERPHGALAGVTPASYVKKLKEKTRKAA